MCMDNNERAYFAEKALNTFLEVCPGDQDCAIRDLITNLLHLADKRKMDTLDEARMAVGMWKDEQRYPLNPGPCGEHIDVDIDITIHGKPVDDVPIAVEAF